MRLLKDIRNLTENYHVKSGMYHYFRAEYKQAEEFFQKALKSESALAPADRRQAHHYLTLTLIDHAKKLEDAGNPEEGAELLRRASDTSPRFPDIHYRLGRTHEKLGAVDLAIESYRQAIACGSKYLDAHVALGFCLLRNGRHEEAIEAFDRARDIRIARVNAPCDEAMERLRNGDAEEAGDLFHSALVSSVQLCEEYLSKAMERVREEAFEKALEQFDLAIGQCPKYPDLHNFRGIVLHELERIDEAVEAFRLSTALAPQYLVPRLNLAFALVEVGDLKEAEAELEAILEEDPSEPAAAAKLEELRSGRVPEKRRPVSRGIAR